MMIIIISAFAFSETSLFISFHFKWNPTEEYTGKLKFFILKYLRYDSNKILGIHIDKQMTIYLNLTIWILRDNF